MPNLLTFTADRRILFCSAALVAIGALLGTIATSAVLLSRLHEYETVTRSLKDFIALQSSRITSLTAINAAGSTSIRAQATPTLTAPIIETPSRSPAGATLNTASTLPAEPIVKSTAVIPTLSVAADSASNAPSAVSFPLVKIPANPPPRLVAKVVQRPAPLAPASSANLANSSKDPRIITAPTKAVTAGLSQPANSARDGAKEAISAPSTVATATVTLEQAGITGMDSSGVRFKSGRLVSIGTEFPSGEKLLSVSPTDGRIVTDRRVIVVAKPPLEK